MKRQFEIANMLVSKSRSWWALEKFGKLRIKTPDDISLESDQIVEWVCECGQVISEVVSLVSSGGVRSCGGCEKTPLKLGTDRRMKNELAAKVEEIDAILEIPGHTDEMISVLQARKQSLLEQMKDSLEDVISAAVSSHHVMCEVKNMRPDEAFGNDPFIYYGLGLAGEVGELTGALLRAMRNGGAYEDMKMAAESELADCMIYAVILAHSTGIDLVKLVNEKARIVELRARSGYYGGPINR